MRLELWVCICPNSLVQSSPNIHTCLFNKTGMNWQIVRFYFSVLPEVLGGRAMFLLLLEINAQIISPGPLKYLLVPPKFFFRKRFSAFNRN